MSTAKPQRTRLASALAFADLADWIEVFRAGTHTDSKGTECTFTEADLDQMVANVALGKPPAVLGHPEHDDPAYGWGELKRDGESLYAKFDDVNPDFEAGVKSGAYRNRSVAVVKDKTHGWRVRHIGWLGAKPPAIDGLKPVQFSADDGDEQHEFASGNDFTISWALGDLAALLRGVRDWVIQEKGIEAADKVLPAYQIDSVSNAATRLREQPEATPYFHAPNDPNGDPSMSFTKEDLERAAEEAAAKVRTEMAAQFAAQGTQLKQLQTERQAERIQGQIDGWKAAGKLPPADEPGLREFMGALEGGSAQSFEFTAADGKTAAKQTPAEWFACFMAARKPAVELRKRAGDPESEPAPQVDIRNGRAIGEAAQQYMADEKAKGRVITLEAAVDHVMKQNAPAA